MTDYIHNKVAPNFALFEFFTKPCELNNNKIFTYDFDNAFGDEDFTVFFASRVLSTHKGQCFSMPLLYKILCDELGGGSFLALAPMHMYIKHIGEEGGWVNVELTHGGFVRDVWIIEQHNVSTEAIRNGVFMCALSPIEEISLMLAQLCRTYYAKYKSYDYFIERGVNKVLSHLPHFCEALALKHNLLYEQCLMFLNKYGEIDSLHGSFMLAQLRTTFDLLNHLGYSFLNIEEVAARLAENKRLYQK